MMNEIQNLIVLELYSSWQQNGYKYNNDQLQIYKVFYFTVTI